MTCPRQKRIESVDSEPWMVEAGKRLKQAREQTGMTIRDVEQASARIAKEYGNPECSLSNGYLSRLERGSSLPSAAKMIALCKIYHLKFFELLGWFHLEDALRGLLQIKTDAAKTHLASFEINDAQQSVRFPVRFASDFNPRQTGLVSNTIGQWENLPIALILSLMDIPLNRCGYVGLDAYELSPLVQPGAFFLFDEKQTKVENIGWKSEYDRPIYLIEMRQGRLCCWCTVLDRILTVTPHHLSGRPPRHFAHPQEAEILGRVTWYCNPAPSICGGVAQAKRDRL